MRKIWSWVKNNPNRTMFLIPIILVAGISISHVVSWYDIANPINWAIYLSIAIEVGAMTALVAATNRIKGGVWFMFGLVTFIQFVGNIFYSYKEIDPTGNSFKMWVELTGPIWDMFSDSTDVIAMKRWLAILEGGFLPLISLASLHFFVKYEKTDGNKPQEVEEEKDWKERLSEEPTNPPPPPNGKVFYIDLKDLPTKEEQDEYVKDVAEKFKKQPEFESESDFNLMDYDEDATHYSLVEEENPEDEILDAQVGLEKEMNESVRETADKIDQEIMEEKENTQIRNGGEELSQTWRNIFKRRKGNNGISRI